MKKWVVGIAVVAASALTAVSLAFAGSTTLKLAAAKASLAYNKKVLTAKPGKVTIVMSNPSFLSHDVAIKGNGVKVKGKVVGKGDTSKVTANLKMCGALYLSGIKGNVTAQIYWMKTQAGRDWHEKYAHEHSGPGGTPIPHAVATAAISDEDAMTTYHQLVSQE